MHAVVIGGGLAGTEAAFQLAERGVSVTLVEMKPHKRTPAQVTDRLAELVCSNSLRGASLNNAVGLLKEEMRRSGSLIMRAADATRVPAGGALAVDRDKFSGFIEQAMQSHPLIEVAHREVEALPEGETTIVATGPLTSDALASAIAARVGEEHLAYYDAISPIVAADSLNEAVVFRQSRYDKGGADDAYVNCPFSKEEYFAFVEALKAAEKVEPKSFEKIKYFEGCLPVEVMAERGERTLAFGPMKPVGLTDPRTGRWPYAVVQLRAEDEAKTAYNIVGFQTRMKYGEQDRVFRMIPGLERAEFMRYGTVHRNTFVNAPKVLTDSMELGQGSRLFFAGQVTGVEGYVESAASGLVVGRLVAARLQGLPEVPPPRTTALGSLMAHTRRQDVEYQPSNITWAHFCELHGAQAKLRKDARYEAYVARALADLDAWNGLKTSSSPQAAAMYL